MALATVDDVKARWTASDLLPEDSQLEALLEDAELVCVSAVPTLLEKVAQDPTGQLEKNVVYVECQLVMQVLVNPKGIRQVSNTSGPFSQAITDGAETIRAGMVLSSQQLQLLGAGKGRMFTIDMTPKTAAPQLYPSQVINWPEVG